MQLGLAGISPPADLNFTITFDGGSLGNPGVGYGSYAIAESGGQPLVTRLEFSANGEIVTNNQAEYRTLISALESLIDRLGADAPRAQVTVRGDSKLVIEQVSGRWKVKNAELRPLAVRVRELLDSFGRAELVWQPRSRSVRTLGH